MSLFKGRFVAFLVIVAVLVGLCVASAAATSSDFVLVLFSLVLMVVLVLFVLAVMVLLVVCLLVYVLLHTALALVAAAVVALVLVSCCRFYFFSEAYRR